MHTVYILYSRLHDKIYTGYTTNLIQRFYSHNFYSNTDWTRSYRPWLVVYTEVFEIKSEATKREKELKVGKGRDWIHNNINDWLKIFNE